MSSFTDIMAIPVKIQQTRWQLLLCFILCTAEVSPHDFPALSGTKTQSPSSSSSAWQFEDPGLDETSACKPAVEGHAQGLVDPYATHSGAKGRKKPQVKKMTLSDLIKIEEAKNSKRSVPNAWGPKPW
eukprot:1084007-Pelagomonas_calceolata.AAC.2